MQHARNLGEYKQAVVQALENRFLREAMDTFAVAYRASRERVFAGMDLPALVAEIARLKDDAVGRLDELYAEFKRHAEAAGMQVHLVRDAAEANAMIAGIARAGAVRRIVKSKSMTAEETLLNHHLEAEGFEVTETDLGEWIIQLRHEGPSHMVMPAIHLSRFQVAELFTRVTGQRQEAEIERLVKVARRELRQKFVEAEMGISGANFALADCGVIGFTTNEGNARLVTSLPRIHVALVGLEKLVPSLEAALTINRVLPRNATGQAITSYVTWIGGRNACAAAADGRKQIHVVFLDNGRRALAQDPLFAQALRCVRCGACANVCPVYRMVGGHQYGHIYIGAIGLILTYFFHGRDKARHLVKNCINCGACQAVCAAGIELPRLIKDVLARVQQQEGAPLQSTLLARALQHRPLFHGLLRAARAVQRPVTGGTPYLRHLPMLFAREQGFRALPAIAARPFRDRWPTLRPKIGRPRRQATLFSGCVQDFVYPEQLEAAVAILARHDVGLAFPMGQSCCGLPVEMMGEKAAARQVALQNLEALEASAPHPVITLCASCASHLIHAYPRLLGDTPSLAGRARRLAARVMPLSLYLERILGLNAAEFAPGGPVATWHAPCHLCRALGIRQEPRSLLAKAGYAFTPADEQETCCGFGGTYSANFPRISAAILRRKLDDAQGTGAALLVTECPGCVMQLRGGVERQGRPLRVLHLAEALHERLGPRAPHDAARLPPHDG
jgi:iron-sulfur cluster protein